MAMKTFRFFCFCFLGAVAFLLLDRLFSSPHRKPRNYHVVLPATARRAIDRDYNETQLIWTNLALIGSQDCPGDSQKRCPEMIACREPSSKVSLCTDGSFTDPEDVVLQTLHFQIDGIDTHVALGYPAFEARLFRIDDVFVNHKGNIFDEHLLYNHGGCLDRTKVSLRSGAAFPSYPDGINLAEVWGPNYYHLMAEMLPAIFQLRPFILDHPDIPLVIKNNSAVEKIFRVLGLENRLKVIPISDGRTIHLNRTYVPLKTECFRSPHTLWKEIRNFFFTHSVPEILGHPTRRKVERLKIVVARRSGWRKIEDFDLLIEKLQRRIKAGEVVVFREKESFERTLEIFSDATILVASHGAGLTNMIFMPDNGVILELLPDKFLVHCFGQLAAALGLEYHMILGAGRNSSPLVVDLDRVVEKVAELAARFR